MSSFAEEFALEPPREGCAAPHHHGAALAPAQAGEEPASEDAGNEGEKQLLEAAEFLKHRL